MSDTISDRGIVSIAEANDGTFTITIGSSFAAGKVQSPFAEYANVSQPPDMSAAPSFVRRGQLLVSSGPAVVEHHRNRGFYIFAAATLDMDTDEGTTAE